MLPRLLYTRRATDCLTHMHGTGTAAQRSTPLGTDVTTSSLLRKPTLLLEQQAPCSRPANHPVYRPLHFSVTTPYPTKRPRS